MLYTFLKYLYDSDIIDFVFVAQDSLLMYASNSILIKAIKQS